VQLFFIVQITPLYRVIRIRVLEEQKIQYSDPGEFHEFLGTKIFTSCFFKACNFLKDFFAQIRSLLIAMVLNRSNGDPNLIYMDESI
jgi:hypothetical protein